MTPIAPHRAPRLDPDTARSAPWRPASPRLARPSPLVSAPRRLWVALVVSLAALATQPSPAQAAPPAWVDGVSEKDQKEARTLFEQANALAKDAFFTRAVERYRQALALWDHPSIHFNLAKTLMSLDASVEAYDHLWAALRFGGQPLVVEQVEQALTYTRLLYRTELTHLVVRCDEPKAELLLGKRTLLSGPGQWEGLVRSGPVSLSLSAGKRDLTKAEHLLSAGRRVEVTCTKRGKAITFDLAERASTEDDMLALARRSAIFPKTWPIDLQSVHATESSEDLGPRVSAPDPQRAKVLAICNKAKTGGDLATVCDAYAQVARERERLVEQAEAARREALAKLRELTRGGLVDTLK